MGPAHRSRDGRPTFVLAPMVTPFPGVTVGLAGQAVLSTGSARSTRPRGGIGEPADLDFEIWARTRIARSVPPSWTRVSRCLPGYGEASRSASAATTTRSGR